MNVSDLPVLTVSSTKCFRLCPRKYKLRYEDGYRAVQTDEPLRVGTLVHKGLEAWWKSVDNALPDAFTAMQSSATDAFDLIRAEELLRGYDARWGNEPIEVLSVESVFYTPLVNPETDHASRTWQLGGKLDVVARLADGRIVLIEHKTSSEDISAGSSYWKRLIMDAQISTYFAGARSLGFEITACWYDVLGKPGIKPLKATPIESRKYTKEGKLYAQQREYDETPAEFRARFAEALAAAPEKFFVRQEIVRLPEEEEDAAFDIWQTARTIRDAQVSKRWPRNPDACVHFGKECVFFRVCAGMGSLDDDAVYRRVANPHEELVESVPDSVGESL